ncbi:glycosyltransferase family 9 protein [uncultured Dokdonia sp.]|uniref:glycosyltransferase family 9 protein n=1 Tax=uncultured Dokdonia sp. TaxID=575653 RepID=UPI002607C5E4|nr:glycosyltransferase family 9 protein [uncultured Dokdonia sp.]
MQKPQHILIIRLSAMGDVAMLIPVIYAFAKAYPETKITVLSKPFFKAIIDTIPNVHFIAAETNTRHKGIVGIWKLSRELKQLGITHIADTHNVLRSKVLRFFLRLPNAKIDKGRAEKKALTSPNNSFFKPLKTTVQRYVEVFKQLGFSEIIPQILSRPNIDREVIEIVGKTKKKLIGIAPFAAHQGKQYPLDLMKEVLQKLDQQSGIQLFLFGAPNEKEVLDSLTEDCENAIVVAGVLRFPKEINLIAQLDAMLSMDSGNGHLAAMYGVPTVSVWGVTHPYAGFAPLYQEAHCLLSDRDQYPAIPTSIYGHKVPEGYEEVMRTITPQTIVDRLMSLL